MIYSLLPAPDDLTIRERYDLTSTIEQIIGFCQRLQLLHVCPTESSTTKRNNWYLGSCSKSIERCKWGWRT